MDIKVSEKPGVVLDDQKLHILLLFNTWQHFLVSLHFAVVTVMAYIIIVDALSTIRTAEPV